MTVEFRAGNIWYRIGEEFLQRLPKPKTKISWSISGPLDSTVLQSLRLGKVLLASWVLARISYLTDGELQKILEQEQSNPGGGYSLKFTVLANDSEPISVFSLNGNRNGVFVFGKCSNRTTPTEVVLTFVSTLSETPDNVKVCRASVLDTSPLCQMNSNKDETLTNNRNYYGWDGECYYGKGNVF